MNQTPEPVTTIPTFLSPRDTIPSSLQHKTSIIVNANDINKLNQYRSIRCGTLHRTVPILITALLTALEQYGLDTNDPNCPNQFELLVSRCRISLDTPNAIASLGANPDGSPINIPITASTKADNANVGAGVKRVSRPGKKTPTVTANSPRTLRRGSNNENPQGFKQDHQGPG